ncbi:MAG TPA: penicillin-binding protein 1A [Pseudomonadales bacterium]|nr:penicillin-binding protein 1A [Pseudomonadales bacterium]
MKFILWLLRFVILGIFLLICSLSCIISGFTLYSGPQLPKIDAVLDLKLQTPLRILSADGRLIGEFGETRRQPLAYSDLPPLFINAVLAAEDDRFFSHGGVDASGLLRAGSELAKTGHIQSGGSTITMQLARNFFLSTEKSFIRKFNEILLSIQLERLLQKEKIFELYANKIYLGHRAYGVQSASYVYYGKNLDQLSLAQWAMLAGLPKAPSKYNPIVNPARALIRRNWILDRMLKLGFIDQNAHDVAIAEPEVASFHGLKTDIDAPYIAEMARQFTLDKLGENAYNDGYSVYTSINSHLQLAAQQAVWEGVLDYDRRHGYRGPEKHLSLPNPPAAPNYWALTVKDINKIGDLEPAIVTDITKNTFSAVLRSGNTIEFDWNQNLSKRLQPYKTEDYLGAQAKTPSQLFQVGDVIRVREKESNYWEIDQIPRVQAALASLDSQTGAIIALAGGSDFNYSKFNRATQALRQPGSSFKPFIYLKALEEGYTPATIINDAPIVFQEAGMAEAWRPENHGDKYNGPTRMRRALYESMNMVSIRILQHIGVKNLIKSLARFGFDTTNMQPNLSLALGSHAFTPLTMASAYTALSNGGYRVEPFFVQRIEDAKGNTVYQQDFVTVCPACDTKQELPETAVKPASRVIDEQNAYIIDDMLKDVIRKGTGHAATALNRPDIAGKTGTTNGPTDAWFVGYNPNITTAAWLGFDDNTLLGKREYGGTAALPIWMTFMREALHDLPIVERTMPAGLTTARIDPDTGQPASADRSDAIFEIFRSNQSIDSTDGRESIPADGESGSVSEDLF